MAAAHTITRVIRGLMTSRLDDDTARTIAVPVLLVTGEHSVDLVQPHASALTETLPHGRVLVLHGQGHVADVHDPELFTATVLPFLKGDS